MNVPRFLQLYKEHRLEEAFESVILDNPLPASTGRVCQRPCESRCQRTTLDEAVNMREVHRRIADSIFFSDRFDDLVRQIASRKLDPTGRKVAVAGAGPAGLTAAFYLALLGHEVTVFDEKSEAGGMLRFAMPEYRLPKAIVRREIELIERMGVKFVLNTPDWDRPAAQRIGGPLRLGFCFYRNLEGNAASLPGNGAEGGLPCAAVPGVSGEGKWSPSGTQGRGNRRGQRGHRFCADGIAYRCGRDGVLPSRTQGHAGHRRRDDDGGRRGSAVCVSGCSAPHHWR